jgi:hypothetical protein
MKHLVVPALALALAAGASADPRAARDGLERAYQEVLREIEPVAEQARAAEELRLRASRVDHDIKVWNYRSRGLDDDRVPRLLPRVLEASRDPSVEQVAAAVFLEAAPDELQDAVNHRIEARYAEGAYERAPFLRPWPDHDLVDLAVGPLRARPGVSLGLMTLLQQADLRRSELEETVTRAEEYRPEVEVRSGPDRWTNEAEWERIERSYDEAQERYLTILEGLRAATFQKAREVLSRHVVYGEREVDAERNAVGRFFRGSTRTERFVRLPEARVEAPVAGGSGVPGFEGLVGGGQASHADSGGALEVPVEDLLDLLPAPVKAAIEYRVAVAYEVGQLESYEEAEEEEEES